ncbi:hypothetical protein GCM10028832_31150 [Streptomyces sparsus]
MPWGILSCMSYPPPNNPQQPGPGGGFGPPQGFGPSEPAGPPAGGYGYPGPPGNPPPGYGQGGPGGYGPQGPGGFGPGGPGPYPPPPGGGGNGPNKAAVTIIAVVLGIAVAIGVVLLVSSGDDDKAKASTDTSASPEPEESASTDAYPTPTDEPTSIPSLDLPSPTADRDSTAPTAIPYVVLPPGTCFNHPSLNSKATGLERRSCNESHDAEVISNRKLTGDYATNTAVQTAALGLCEKDARARLQKVPQDGTLYYPFALFPMKVTYELQGKDTVSCAMTLSNTKDGKQLKAPLPGS